MSVHISGLRHAYTVVMITEAQRRVKERVERRRKTRKASEIRFEGLPNGQARALHRSACVWTPSGCRVPTGYSKHPLHLSALLPLSPSFLQDLVSGGIVGRSLPKQAARPVPQGRWLSDPVISGRVIELPDPCQTAENIRWRLRAVHCGPPSIFNGLGSQSLWCAKGLRWSDEFNFRANNPPS